ncbi:hypothetical protein CAOG_00576 [Capsaspora owczarzaki ATCC 30864]|uniref:CYRIA/CYRIB Rac1 binding domain-containing protein n=1 Tax=Capsaspora owczarzaki (strain ATCC 30864) TaxID=595528 RepID=A0A0D2U1D3_CAPO3|nr:hypothetical protein CAOG_00576 [Capsaspora owczarzaki ATCC 30864]KJE89016.1 hypothetical protein CAOG_000576 [Capsaspora owczarzaki ATCC 30864]|eukprot:XP_004365447.2 hypothetical protein CAOG_00576 [Capsaspora owczarzaki ATCC 30864]
MGNLLQAMRGDGRSTSIDVFLDFENARPTTAESEVWAMVDEVLQQASQILGQLKNYEGCGDQIRAAISKPSQESEEAAWAAVIPQVEKLKTFYEYSSALADNVLPKLLDALCKENPLQNLESKQALVKQLADVFDFVLSFDDAKMKNSNIQNDFSFYRRNLNKMKMSNSIHAENLVVRDELANRMSLFFATPTPMLFCLVNAVSKFVNDNKKTVPVDNVTECLATIAIICQTMVANPDFASRFQNAETSLFCLRVMVGAIILYDHTHSAGAFHKKSVIDVRGSVKILKDQPTASVEGLLNALRFTTKHLGDEDTPKQTKALLA